MEFTSHVLLFREQTRVLRISFVAIGYSTSSALQLLVPCNHICLQELFIFLPLKAKYYSSVSSTTPDEIKVCEFVIKRSYFRNGFVLRFIR